MNAKNSPYYTSYGVVTFSESQIYLLCYNFQGNNFTNHHRSLRVLNDRIPYDVFML